MLHALCKYAEEGASARYRVEQPIHCSPQYVRHPHRPSRKPKCFEELVGEFERLDRAQAVTFEVMSYIRPVKAVKMGVRRCGPVAVDTEMPLDFLAIGDGENQFPLVSEYVSDLLQRRVDVFQVFADLREKDDIERTGRKGKIIDVGHEEDEGQRGI